MVVCKCRKATKLYCFVHKVPVCGECICFPEHQICVVRTYSEWVIDGEYDWPPKCCHCQSEIHAGTETPTTRLGCLHVIHTSCFVSHMKGFPPHTAPAGYVCPVCSTSIWPPKSVKDSGSLLHVKLKEAIMQTGLENLLGNLPVSLPAVEARAPPPAFASDPLMPISGREQAGTLFSSFGKDAEGNSDGGQLDSKRMDGDIMEVDGPSSAFNNNEPSFLNNSSASGPGATTRKGAIQYERLNSDASYYADDEDWNRRKYTRRGPLHHKFLRALLPFWSTALPTLPVTAPSKKDGSSLDDIPEGRTKTHRTSRTDPRKLLLFIAIMACVATMGILYYKISQRGINELPDDDLQ